MKDLPNTARDDYMRDGYVILPDLLDASELDALRDACETLLAEPPDDNKGGAAHNIGRGHDRRFLRHRHNDLPGLKAFVLGDGIKKLVSSFIGDTPYLFNEQFVVKGPKTGASFAWHQDSGYVQFDHKPYLTVWVALDDTTVENGAVYVLPQDMKAENPFIKHRWDDVGKEMVGYEGDDPGVPAIVPAGSVVVFSSVTLHRSSSNTTKKPRRGFIAQYSPEPIIDPETSQAKIFATAL